MARRLTIILLYFVLISKIAYAQVLLNDSLKSPKNDSLSNTILLQNDSLKALTSSQDSKLSGLKFSLDSLSRLTTSIKNNLDSFSNLNQDTLLRFRHQLVSAQEKASSLSKENQNNEMDTLGLGNEAYAIYFKTGGLKGRIDERIRKQENQIIKKKAGYIWTAPVNVTPNDLYNSLKSEVNNPLNAFNKLKNPEWGGLFLLLLLSAGYFYWVLRHRQHSIPTNTKVTLPIAQSLLFFLVLIPFFDKELTSLYMEFILLLILLVSFAKFRSYIKIQFKRWWLSLIVIYTVVLLFNYLLVSNAFFVRGVAISLNIIALYFGYKTATLLKRINDYPGIYRILFAVYVIFNGLAIVLNIIGQINVSKVLSITAIGGAAQLVGLIVLGKIITEDFNRQFGGFNKSNHFLANLDKTKTLSFIHKTLFIAGSFLWLIVFLINLNILGSTTDFLSMILNKPHTFGSLSFTLGNVIVCVIIIWIANWFQKNLNVLLSASNTKKATTQIDDNGTKVTLLRLGVIVLGFLMAVTALGISMTKLTVILGALSVGIGLGMQNIFNNFVSGVILIFEKPFKIGDFITLADKSGRVKKIGIRSSTLLTDQGAEVIIPNGDLLSGRLVNWTHSQSYYQVEFNLKFNASSNLDEVKRVILEEIKENKYSINDSSIEVLYKSVSANDLELTIKCWIINIYKESKFKSGILEKLRSRFTNNEIVSLG